MNDLMAQRNKQVFCYVAQRLRQEGADKTWDQCRIKLKNLKSQYRYVKERLPDVVHLDLEDDDVLKRLAAECQSRGISPSSLKHLRYLRRFLAKMSSARSKNPLHNPPHDVIHEIEPRIVEEEHDPLLQDHDEDEEEAEIAMSDNDEETPPKRARFSNTPSAVERFNAEMMERFWEHQRRVQESFRRWELERQRLYEASAERWRQEAREHEKQMFGLFARLVSECTAALSASDSTTRPCVCRGQKRKRKVKTETAENATTPERQDESSEQDRD